MAKTDDPYDLALKALSYKERTEAELREWLGEREVAMAEIEEAIALLAEAGAIDDASFAHRYAADKRELAGWGPERIAVALESRGVARRHIEAALAGEDETAQLERAVALLGDRGVRCDSERERQRGLALLVRRGYAKELAYEAVRAAVEQGLLAILETTDLFRIHREVRGTLTQPRPGQVDKGVRIDRLLVPNNRLVGMGWRHGIVGVEIKRGGGKIGPHIAQAMVYTRATFQLDDGGFLVTPTWVFVWPEDKHHGPLASLMAQSRVGTVVSNRWLPLRLLAGEANILTVSHTGEVRIGVAASGRKAGSR